MHAHRGQAFQGVTPSFHLSNYQLSKQRYFVVCPLTFYRQRTSRTVPEGVFRVSAGVLQYDVGECLSHQLAGTDFVEAVPRITMIHFNQVEDLDCISIVSKVFAHGFIQFRFWIGKDQALTTLHRLEDQISGYGSGFACARRATYGEVGIEACVFGGNSIDTPFNASFSVAKMYGLRIPFQSN